MAGCFHNPYYRVYIKYNIVFANNKQFFIITVIRAFIIKQFKNFSIPAGISQPFDELRAVSLSNRTFAPWIFRSFSSTSAALQKDLAGL
jgi:hypothetical protein